MITKQPKPIAILTVVVAVYTAFLLYRIVGAMGQTAAYPNEYREAANIAMTQAILDGTNIYSVENAAKAVPTVCYLYGPLMSVMAAAIALVFPVLSLPLIHYGISLAAMLISGYLIAKMVARHTRTILAPTVAFMMTIFCHWRYGYVYGAPDSLGLCLMIGAIYVLSLVRDSYNRRKGVLDKCLPELGALLAVLTFFTKQYFIIVAITGAVYLLFVSKKLFVRYAVSGVVISAAAFGTITLTCPLYWTYSLYFLKGPGPGAAMGKTGIAYNNMQISYLGGMLLTLFIAVAVTSLALLIGVIKHTKFTINIKSMDAPLFMFTIKNTSGNSSVSNLSFYILMYSQLLLSAVILRYIGNNDGAFLSYYLQLFTPALIATAVTGLDNMELGISAAGADKSRSGKAKLALLCVLYIIFVGYTIYKVEPRLIINKLSDEEMANWQRAYEIADEYVALSEASALKDADVKTSELLRNDSIYYVPPMNFHGYANHQYIYNDGQPFVFTKKFLDKYYESDIARKLYPHGGDIIAQHLSFREEIRQRVLNGDYELVMFIEDQDPVFTKEELMQQYKCKEIIPLRTGNWAWEVEFWVRNKIIENLD